MKGSFSVQTWVAIAVPVGAFLVGLYGVGVWKGDVSTRLSAVEIVAKNNEETHRTEMWAQRLYLHRLDKNILVIATKMKIPKNELSIIELEVPKRAGINE